jgi:hypothetical protein
MGDLIYQLTEWLRSTPLSDFALAMSDSPLTLWIVERFWAIPILQMVHILAIAGSFAAVLMLNARIFGLAGHATMAETAHRYTRVLWWSLAVVVLSGGLMLFGDTVRNLINAVFWIKMILVILGIVVSILFAKAMSRRLAEGDTVGGGVKVTAVFLVLLWCLIMWCGRWIAYAPV